MTLKNKIGFVHTTPPTITMVDEFMKQYLPEAEVVHFYDGNVKIENFSNPPGETPKWNMRRYVAIAGELEAAGCDLIVSCCSLMPRVVAYAAQAVDIPFVQLDSPALDEAVDYARVGVVNTTEYTVPYIIERLQKYAAAKDKNVEIVFSNTTEALDLFNVGDFTMHDDMVIDAMHALDDKGVDCILMGQIPMGIMERRIEAEKFSVPVIVPGKSAFAYLAKLLER